MAKPCGDMIASLTRLPEVPTLPEGVQLKRALCIDRQRILQFIQENFGDGWRNEAETTLASCPSRCVLAVKDEQIIGFACWDATAKGLFGPIGVTEACRGTGVGSALLLRVLAYMRDEGYAYAVIGWVTDAAPFYEKLLGATFIPGGEPQHSVYSQLVKAYW